VRRIASWLLLTVLLFAVCTLTALAAPETSWHRETLVSDLGGYGAMTTLAVDQQLRPHVFHYGYDKVDLTHWFHDGSRWVTQTLDTNGGWYPAAACDQQNRIHISYSDGDPCGLAYGLLERGVWSFQVIEYDCCPQYSDIAVDSAGVPHVSYYACMRQEVCYATIRDSQWVTQTVEHTGDEDNKVRQTSIAVDSMGHPHIAYHHADLARARYAWLDGSGWHHETVYDGAHTGTHLSMALDSNGAPRVAHYDTDAGRLRYSERGETGWSTEMLDGSMWGGYYPSLVLDANDVPFIAYERLKNGDLTLAQRENVTWTYTVLDSDGTVGYFTQMVMDRFDRPHIATTEHDARAVLYLQYGHTTRVALPIAIKP